MMSIPVPEFPVFPFTFRRSPASQPLSSPLQVGIRFLGLPLPAALAVCPYGQPGHLWWQRIGLTVFRVSDNGEVRRCLSPGGFTAPTGNPTVPVPPTCLLATAFQHLWLFWPHERSNDTSFVFAMLSIPSPPLRDARSSVSPSRGSLHPFGMGYVVGTASDRIVANSACVPREPVGAHRVLSCTSFCKQNNHLHDFTSHAGPAS